MLYARIRPQGSEPHEIVIGKGYTAKDTLEDLWLYIQRNLTSYISPWAMPSCPNYLSQLELLKHVSTKDKFYYCTVDSTAVFCYRFYSEWYKGLYILEVWSPDTEYGLDEKYFTRSSE